MNTSWYKYTFIVVNQTNNHIELFPLGGFIFWPETFQRIIILEEILNLLMRGTASDVLGMESETWLRKTVSDSRTVTSEMLSSVMCLWVSLVQASQIFYLLFSFILYFQISKLQRQTFSLGCFSQQYQGAASEGIYIEAVGAIEGRKMIIIETKNNIWTAKPSKVY